MSSRWSGEDRSSSPRQHRAAWDPPRPPLPCRSSNTAPLLATYDDVASRLRLWALVQRKQGTREAGQRHARLWLFLSRGSFIPPSSPGPPAALLRRSSRPTGRTWC